MAMMMWTITKLIVFFSVAMGAVNGSGLFHNTDYFPAPQNQFTNYTMGEVNSLSAPATSPGIGDYFMTLVSFFISATLIIANIVVAVVAICPYLFWVFGLPVYLAAPIQAGIYIQYAIGWAQWKARAPTKMYE